MQLSSSKDLHFVKQYQSASCWICPAEHNVRTIIDEYLVKCEMESKLKENSGTYRTLYNVKDSFNTMVPVKIAIVEELLGNLIFILEGSGVEVNMFRSCTM